MAKAQPISPDNNSFTLDVTYKPLQVAGAA
jgi:hypothetical protein